jgi:hypothetical protein
LQSLLSKQLLHFLPLLTVKTALLALLSLLSIARVITSQAPQALGATSAILTYTKSREGVPGESQSSEV